MSDDNTIHPTHECFDDIADFLNDLAERGATREELTQYTVVHGLCLMPPNGEPYAHGWLERDGFAIQAGIYRGERIYFRVPVEEYRASRFVWDETRYTLDEVLELDLHDRPPYRAEYKGLCSDTRPEPREPREWPAPPMTIVDAWKESR